MNSNTVPTSTALQLATVFIMNRTLIGNGRITIGASGLVCLDVYKRQLFNSYEAFIRIVDSMFSQHAKWLKVTLELPWRRKIACLLYTSRCV